MLKGLLRIIVVSLFFLPLACKSKNPNAPARVSGVVKYKGEVLKTGTVTFSIADQKSGYSSAIQPDGTYQIVDLPSGKFEVTIETASFDPNKKVPVYGAGKSGKAPAGAEQARAMGAPDPKLLADRYREIPKKYADRKTSGLSATLTSGKQSLDFDLTD